MRSRIFSVFLSVVLLALLVSGPSLAQDEWVVRSSSQSVPDTVARLEQAIERSGSRVLAVFDHEAAAQEIDYVLAPTTVVVFAQPKASLPLIEANRRLAIEMPQKILVWEEDGTTYVGYVSPFSMVGRYALDPAQPEIEALRSSLDALVSAALSRPERRSGIAEAQ
ncbi:DUF302 domain-containing protein [Aureimonas populi]|uniref:DUF302 domain-containing protein n=1 Tax=Aureimonas populi TaxID=1701758 RepID=A0ABW5CMU2_9HYPH|nr:DUF302 domain-containing protein [Aureimonas populi]